MWIVSAGIVALSIQTIATSRNSDALDSKIVGGFKISLEQAPFLVSIQIHGFHACGGAILTLSHVISGCHCLGDVDAGMPHNQIQLRPVAEFRVVAGTENIEKPTREIQERNIYDAKIHPNCSYDPILVYDFAVAFLEEPLKETAKVRSFTMVPKDDGAFYKDLLGSRRPCYVAGWGATTSEPERQRANSVLKAARMVPITDAECRAKLGLQNVRYSNYSFTDKGQLCSLAYGHRKNESDCNGDSGGPFFCGSKVYGLVSYGFKCGQWDVPNVYAKMSFAVDWLRTLHLEERRHKSEGKVSLRRVETSSATPTTEFPKMVSLLLSTLSCRQLIPTRQN